MSDLHGRLKLFDISLKRSLKILALIYDRTLATAKQHSNKKNTQQNKASSSKPYI